MPISRRAFLGSSILSAAALSTDGRASSRPWADLILRNAKVTTLDEKQPNASALAVAQGSVLAIGSDNDITHLVGPATLVLDAGGRRVIPGLNDSHLHFVRGSLSYNLDVRWDGVPTLARALQKLTEQAARTPSGQWVRVGGGWSEFQFAEKRLPTLDELNKAVPDRPAYVLHFYESSMVNRAGLVALGLDKAAQDIPGGKIVRDGRGRPTGLFLARPLPGAILAPEAKMPALSPADQRNSIQQFMRELNRLGMTSVVDPGGIAQPYPDLYGPLTQLALNDQLSLRVGMYFAPPTPGGEFDDFKRLVSAISVGGPNEWFRFVGAGELLENAAQDWDLYTTPEVPIPKSIEAPMEQAVRLLVQNGWYLREHATHDTTAIRYLDVLERVNRDTSLDRTRCILDHVELVSDQSLERLKALGGGVAVQHRAAFHGEYALKNYGQVPMHRAPPLRKLLDLKIPIGAGTDATRDTTYNPWVSLRWLVTGKTVGGVQLASPENCLSREEALRLYTAGSAWISGEENDKGTLSTGKRADFAVLSDDYIALDAERLPEITSLLTVVGGRIAHATGPFAEYSPTQIPVSPVWSPVEIGSGYFHGT